MAKQSGISDRLFVDGFDLSGDVGSISTIHGGGATLDVTGINSAANERIGGLRDGSMTFSAFMNDAAGQAHQRLKTLPTADVLVTYLRGPGIGNAAATLAAKQISYDGSRDNSGALTYTVDAQANAFGIEWGQQLTNGIRTDSTATSPATGLDTGVSLSFGAQAFLQVFAVTGTSVTVTLQDSADNSAFTTISGAVFTAATTTGGQRLALANTATIRQYVRAITTGTFTVASFCVQFTKNISAGQVW